MQALTWLASQLAWEQRLFELRTGQPIDARAEQPVDKAA